MQRQAQNAVGYLSGGMLLYLSSHFEHINRFVDDVNVIFCGNPDPTEEFEPRQRPLRGQVVHGRYVPLGAATRERAPSAPVQSRRCGAVAR